MLASSLASTLGEIHRRGVIHKELKPSNLILTPEGEGCIIDFGSATLQRVEHVDSARCSCRRGTCSVQLPQRLYGREAAVATLVESFKRT
ncbi:MAG TPA: hypothetical protein VEU33_01565, partial [Archangium sp.]|nr:hypothetical protein [Archangium sp.]